VSGPFFKKVLTRRRHNRGIMWRLLKDGIRDPYRHFAVEEALTRGIDDGITPPTLRLRQAEPSVWIGVYQYPDQDVDVDYCTKKGIKIVRRPNPGGAVYQDSGSFCYSLFFPKGSATPAQEGPTGHLSALLSERRGFPQFPGYSAQDSNKKDVFSRLEVKEAGEFYAITGKAVIETCRDFGVRAEFSPVNDVTIGGRKVYGSAQVEFYSAFVHSGTFLVKTDLEEMERCLKPSQLKFKDKGFSSVRDRVINLCTAAGKDIEIAAVMEKLVQHLAEVLQVEFYEDGLSPGEISLVDKLYAEKYADPAWTFRKKDSYDTVVSTKSRSGVITLEISLEGEIIVDLNVKGDFLVPDQGELKRVIDTLRGKRLGEVSAVVEPSRLPGDIRESLIGLLRGI
jgi:lipoate-protein ligase A